jgi:DNA-binding CsgD family transcriptional regulator
VGLVHTQAVLLGRERECARIDQLLDDARAGRSGALVVRGEAGVGKSALLAYAVERAADARVVRATGVETESEFAFAGLHELLLPLLDRLEELPPVQAAALRGALALEEAQGVGRLYIGAATLSLLAAASGGGALLCVVDDAHALDLASADALTFAARRLDAEGVVMLFAAREIGADGFPGTGLPELALGGLEPGAAASLVERATSGAVSPVVGAELAAATGGNPLALIDLAQRLTADQLAGVEPLPHPLPLGAGLQAAFAEQAARLSDEGRRALVIAATADTRAMRVITRAGGANRTAFEECEDAGLLAISGGEVDFSHPLVRSSVYQQASAAEKRDAHRAVADAFADDERYAERRAWHAAAAAMEADEDVAAQLELAGDAASSRRGQVSAAAMFERAARLTPDDGARARRLYRAARASWLAGQSDRARRLLEEAEPSDVLVRADAAHLLARIAQSRGDDGPDLVAEAALVEHADPGRAAVLLATAVETVPVGERLGLARRALDLAGGLADAADLLAQLALARTLAAAGEASDAVAALARAKTLIDGELAQDPELLLAAVDTVIAVDPHDDAFTRAMLDTATVAARGHALAVLPRALLHSAWLDFTAGRWTDAYLSFVEAARLADETGQPRERTAGAAGRALLDALQGRDDAARAATAELPAATSQRILGTLELGNGGGDAASGHLAHAANDGGERLLLRGLPPAALDLTEAHIRAGRREEAVAAAAAIPDRDPSSAWAAGLLGDATAFETAAPHFANVPLLAARLALNKGEALRRAGTRRDARVELDAALELFDALGAAPWAERARQELRASGATVRAREASAAGTLTPQELQVARTVATEASYKEAAAKLFLSPKTVEYHLHKVYRKLGITSGRQLMQRLSEEGLLE